MTKSLVVALDATESTIKALKTHRGQVVAINYRTHMELRDAGIDVVELGRLASEADQQDQLERILAAHTTFAKHLKALHLTPQEAGLILLMALRFLTCHCRLSGLDTTEDTTPACILNGETSHCITDLLWPTTTPGYASTLPLGQRPQRPSLPFLPFTERFQIDCRSFKGDIRKRLSGPPIIQLEFDKKYHPNWLGQSRNLLRVTRDAVRKDAVIKCKLPFAHVWPQLLSQVESIADPTNDNLDVVVRRALGHLTRNQLLEMRRMAPVLNDFVARHGDQIECVKLNCVTEPFIAQLVASLNGSPALVTMESHGNIVEHGSDVRTQVAKVLSANGYNDFPGVDIILPRSKLQVPCGTNQQRVLAVNRVGDRSGKHLTTFTQERFNVLLAPNFIVWPNAQPGMVMTCFECANVVEFAAKTIAGVARLELAIRIKTTTSDLSTEKNLQVERGFRPDNVAHLFQLADNIVDSNLGSHSEGLRRADLVITEGLTKVVYEALEARTPVLMLNWDGSRTPSVPAVGVRELASTTRRHCIYHACCDAEFLPFVQQILQRHNGAELTDDELSSVLWTEAETEADRTNAMQRPGNVAH